MYKTTLLGFYPTLKIHIDRTANKNMKIENTDENSPARNSVNKLNQKFGAKPNVSPPGALSPIGGEILRGEIPPVAKSRGPHTNALAYAKRVLLTQGGNISCVISGVTGPKFTKFFLFNAVLIVLDNAFYRLSIALFVLEIFAVKLESCRKTY